MNLSNGALTVFERLKKAGFRADVVGGSVRDFLLGKTPGDYDMTTSATPEEMLAVFSDFHVIKTGLKHGTLTVVVNKEPVEVTTYRQDGGYLDHRHPERVTFTTNLLEDLSRRDFTVNAMCYHPDFGFTDAFGGRIDLENRVIRCVGDPFLRFREDALRILRALRFAATLGFAIEEQTAKAIHELYPLLRDISAERIYAEWRKWLEGQNARKVILEFSDVVAFLFPNADITVPKNFASDSFKMRFMELLWQDKERTKHFSEICKRLKTEKSILDFGTSVLSEPPIQKSPTRGELLRVAYRLGKENARDFFFLSDCNDGGKRTFDFDVLMAENPVVSLSELAVNGEILKTLGYQGVRIGQLLTELLYAVMDGKVENQKDKLLSFLQEKCK